MNKAAAKSWLNIYRVIDCIDVLFNPNAPALATRNLNRSPDARRRRFRSGHFSTVVKR
jgi:hypothetical protein